MTKITGTGSTLYAAIANGSGYGGVAISTDRGRSFVVRGKDDGIPDTNVDDVAASGSDVYAATFSGFGDSANGGATFVRRTVNPSSGTHPDGATSSPVRARPPIRQVASAPRRAPADPGPP